MLLRSLCFAIVLHLLLGGLLCAQGDPSRAEVLAAIRKSVGFYAGEVATEGGYHFYYTEDLRFGRSESAQGPTQIEFQRESTPDVAMAYLEAYEIIRERFLLDAARETANAYLQGQQCSGGWDYFVEFDPAKRGEYAYRSDGNCSPDLRGVTNLDDNVTQSAVRVMMRLDRALGFQDAAIHEAVTFALSKLIEAQYPIGAWPQRFRQAPDHSRFPIKRASYPETWSRDWPGSNYQQHYTLNDNTLADTIDMMLEAYRIYNEPRYLASAERGGQFLLLAQMPEPQPAWAQQYDVDMHPAWARVFEPPAVTGGESQSAMRILMTLYRETGDRKYIEPIPRAVAYLKRSIVPPSTTGQDARRRINGPALARFYELETNRPLYITKGTRMSVAGLGSRLVDGYKVTYDDRSVITHYGVLVSGAWLEEIEQDYRWLLAQDKDTLARPQSLRGLSPFAQRPGIPDNDHALAARAQRVLSEMDARGAWVTEGTIGKPDRLVFLYAANDLVLRIGRGASDGAANRRADTRPQLIQLKEDDTVEIFQGDDPPRERILDSSVFADNLRTLARYWTHLSD